MLTPPSKAAGDRGQEQMLTGVDPVAEKKEKARQEKLRLDVALDDYEALDTVAEAGQGG